MVACWRPVGSGGIHGGLEARLGAAAGGSIKACWVFMELGVVTPAWASACARMWGPRGGVWRWCFGTALRGFSLRSAHGVPSCYVGSAVPFLAELGGGLFLLAVFSLLPD